MTTATADQPQPMCTICGVAWTTQEIATRCREQHRGQVATLMEQYDMLVLLYEKIYCPVPSDDEQDDLYGGE